MLDKVPVGFNLENCRGLGKLAGSLNLKFVSLIVIAPETERNRTFENRISPERASRPSKLSSCRATIKKNEVPYSRASSLATFPKSNGHSQTEEVLRDMRSQHVCSCAKNTNIPGLTE